LSQSAPNFAPRLLGRAETNPKDLSFELTLNAVTLAITTCRSAIKLNDVRKAGRVLQKAKRYYSAVLRYSGPLLTPDRICWLEFKSVELEGAIAQLEAKCIQACPDGKINGKRKAKSRLPLP
jgi:hypothetical protein